MDNEIYDICRKCGNRDIAMIQNTKVPKITKMCDICKWPNDWAFPTKYFRSTKATEIELCQ